MEQTKHIAKISAPSKEVASKGEILNQPFPANPLQEAVIALLNERGIALDAVAELIYDLQIEYYHGLTMEQCHDALLQVLSKRDVQHAVFTGLALDMLTERGAVADPLRKIIALDAPLYGMDEVLGMAIANIYGTIGVTGFGYLDKTKPGLIGTLDNDAKQVNTFADDLVAALAAAGAAKLAHGKCHG